MRSKKQLGIGLFLLCLLFVASTMFGQTSTTGAISGMVKDPSGASMPGVSVTVNSPNLIRPQTATTGSDGTYTILNLPPGLYTITVEAVKGFAKFEQKGVPVNLGRTASGDISLQLASATTEVSVSVSAATIDTESATVGSNVSTDQFSYFPTARSVQGLYTIAPAVTRSGLRDASGRDRDPSVAGSSGPENNYILDGVSTSDPAFGGGGANLPFEFVQEVEIKTAAYSAEYGKSTGGIFNVITKSGGNNFHGDAFGYFTGKDLVRAVENFPFTGSAANGFSEKDIGGDLGGPIVRNKLWFFGAVNPQFRTNYYLTQTFHNSVQNDVTTPFYAGKVTYALNDKNTLTFSTFGDFTRVEGFLANGALSNVSGFGSDVNAFKGIDETGGHNYSFRLNSVITPHFIAEISGGLHYARRNVLPLAASKADPAITDNFAVLAADGSVLPVTQTGIMDTNNVGDDNVTKTGFVDYVDGRGGALERNYLRGPGFGLFTQSDRNRYDFSAHLQNTMSKHSLKYGFEWSNNVYNNIQTSSGGPISYGNPNGYPLATPDSLDTANQRVTNRFSVCTVRGSEIVCPSSTAVAILSSLPASSLPAGISGVTTGDITQEEAFGNPFLVRTSTRVRDFELNAKTHSVVYSGYIQDDWKLFPNFQLNLGLRLDMQEGYNTNDQAYIKLNQLIPDIQPRLGFIWDFTGSGKGKLSVSYARFLETPIPLDVNVRAGGGTSQTDKNMNVDTLNGPSTSNVLCCVNDFGSANLGASATPVDPNLRPQTLEEYTAALEFEVPGRIILGARGVYRNYVNIIEDGSFDDGNTYFLFNPGRRNTPDSKLPQLLAATQADALNGTNTAATLFPNATTEDKACSDAAIGCFGPARRYYRGLEFTATRRFLNHYQFIASYTYSSLIGNYEGLFRNDNGQSDPNITSLFDLVSLLGNTYGRLPNDRPHQFKFNGSYETPFNLMVSGNFYIQSGSPFNQLIPHPVYGDNEGFGLPRGTAIVPVVAATQSGFPNVVDSIGNNRTPTTWNTDLGFSYPIKFTEKVNLRLSADWFNVTNSQRAVTLDQTFLINSGVINVPDVSNPFYGAALLVQPPSQWRFGAKFSF
ncbi:MAG: carboxypeptidase regulatory-like domain-containing protein [Acidobacteriaceae bacterium]